METLSDRISIDPQVCGGKPCIKGTRIWVSLILDLLAAGKSEAEVRDQYPQLTHDDILAAIAYGAEAERILPRVSKATGGLMPGVDLTRFSDYQEMEDLEYIERMKQFK